MPINDTQKLVQSIQERFFEMPSDALSRLLKHPDPFVTKLVNAQIYASWAMGELGEIIDVIKKEVFRKEVTDINLEEVRHNIEAECADAVVYLCVIATLLEVDLLDAVEKKCDVIEQRLEQGYYGTQKRS